MQKYRLGNSDLEITPVGVGTAPISSTPDWWVYWGPQDEQESINTIHAALEQGVNWIDTAPFYGWGRGEEIVGKALRGRRDQVYIFTKCGKRRDAAGKVYEDLRPASIRQEVEDSLRRLQTDVIDVYQFHDIDPNTPIEESWAEMQRLIEAGKVRYGGLSNHTPDLIQRAAAVAPVTSTQDQYNLLNRKSEATIFPVAQECGIGVLAWSPLASGYLVEGFDPSALHPDDFRRKRPETQPERWSKIAAFRETLKGIARRYHKTLHDLAIAWILGRPAVTGAIIGARSVEEARHIGDGVGWSLTDEDQVAIRAAFALLE